MIFDALFSLLVQKFKTRNEERLCTFYIKLATYSIITIQYSLHVVGST